MFCKVQNLHLTGAKSVEAAVLDTINSVDLSVSGAASIVLRDLSEYATLPFIAAFSVSRASSADLPKSQEHKPTKRVTYIALTKKVTPLLLDIFLQFRGTVDIYNDETVESILSVRVFVRFTATCFSRSIRRTQFP
jgi:hypothetical protein